MAYFLNPFSPETFNAFNNTAREITGFRERYINAARNVHPGDKLLCYLTKVSRWIGILEIVSEFFVDEEPVLLGVKDVFVIRFRVKPVAWLPVTKALPIREDFIWSNLSFTKSHDKATSQWTGKLRASLTRFDDNDGRFLEQAMVAQTSENREYPLEPDKVNLFST